MHLLDRLKIVRVEQNDEDETLNATAAFIVDTALKMIISKMWSKRSPCQQVLHKYTDGKRTSVVGAVVGNVGIVVKDVTPSL